MNLRTTSLALAITALLMPGSTAAQIEVPGLGPILPLGPDALRLDVRRDGTAGVVMTENTPRPELNGALREATHFLLSPGAEGALSSETWSTIAGPGTRFYYGQPDIALYPGGAVVAFPEKVVVAVGDLDEFLIQLYRIGPNERRLGDPISIGTGNAWSIDPPARVGANGSGLVAVVFGDELLVEGSRVLARVMAPDGTLSAPSVVLNETPAFGSASAPFAFNPAVAVSDAGVSVFVWDETRTGRGTPVAGRDIRLRRLDASGTPVGPSSRVNATTDGTRARPEIAVMSDGSLVVVWEHLTASGDPRIVLRRFASDATPMGDEQVLPSPPSGNPRQPVVACAEGLGCLTAWEDQAGPHGTDIFGQWIGASGAFEGLTLLLNEGSRTGDQTRARLGMGDDGRFLAVWSDAGRSKARWGRWRATNAIPVLGPRVASVQPSLPADGSIRSVLVGFDRAMAAESVDPSDFTLRGPFGDVLPILGVTAEGDRAFRVAVGDLATSGRYQLVVGPRVQDAFGAWHDADQDSAQGEVTDHFDAEFYALPTAHRRLPFVEGFAGRDLPPGWGASGVPGALVQMLPSNSDLRSPHLFLVNPGNRPDGNGGGFVEVIVAFEDGAIPPSTRLLVRFDARTHDAYFNGLLLVAESSDGVDWQPAGELAVGALPRDRLATYSFPLGAARPSREITPPSRRFLRFRSHVPAHAFIQAPAWIRLDDIGVVVGDETVLLRSPTWTSAGGFLAELVGAPNTEISVEASSDLRAWAPAGSVRLPASGRLEFAPFSPIDGPAAYLFFRARNGSP